jgi:hypothetical protein
MIRGAAELADLGFAEVGVNGGGNAGMAQQSLDAPGIRAGFWFMGSITAGHLLSHAGGLVTPRRLA